MTQTETKPTAWTLDRVKIHQSLPPHPKRKPEAPASSDELQKIGSRIMQLLPTPSITALTCAGNGQTSLTTTSDETQRRLNAVSLRLGERGVETRLSLPSGTSAWQALLELENRLTGSKLSPWLNGKRTEVTPQPGLPGYGVTMKATWIQPDKSCLSDVLAVHDLVFTAMRDRVTGEFLARTVQGLYSTMKARGSMSSQEGAQVWRYALGDLPAGCVEQAFADWVKDEEWMPTPAEIRDPAQTTARRYRRLERDCKRALTEWAMEKDNG